MTRPFGALGRGGAVDRMTAGILPRKIARVEIRIEFADGEIEIVNAAEGSIRVDVTAKPHLPNISTSWSTAPDPRTTVTVSGIERWSWTVRPLPPLHKRLLLALRPGRAA